MFFNSNIIQNKGQFEIVDRDKNQIEILSYLNNEFFASASNDCKIRIYNVKNNKCIKVLFGFNENIISISSNNFFLFGLSGNYKIYCWILKIINLLMLNIIIYIITFIFLMKKLFFLKKII